MDIQQVVLEHLRERELDLDRVLRACVAAAGLEMVLAELGTLFGNSGQIRRRSRKGAAQ